jgi:hypothetical protein
LFEELLLYFFDTLPVAAEDIVVLIPVRFQLGAAFCVVDELAQGILVVLIVLDIEDVGIGVAGVAFVFDFLFAGELHGV